MLTPIFLASLLCIGIAIYMSYTKRKQKKERENSLAALRPGVRVGTIGGLKGTVTEVTDKTIKLDLSPDNAGSIVEIDKFGFYKLL